MKSRVNDRRSDDQINTLTVLVYGTDSFLSGWGQAADGISVAAWACRPEDAPLVEAWVDRREDVFDVDVCYDSWPKRRFAHLSIYPVTENHPALKGTHDD